MLFNEKINPVYVNGLIALVEACAENGVKITEIRNHMNGFIVLFDVEGGDAILHDGSYGRGIGEWETMGFPWDGIDVSVHDADTLAQLLAAVKNGEDWQEIEGE